MYELKQQLYNSYSVSMQLSCPSSGEINTLCLFGVYFNLCRKFHRLMKCVYMNRLVWLVTVRGYHCTYLSIVVQ